MDDLHRLISKSRNGTKSACYNILQGDESTELKLTRCYYCLSQYDEAIKLYENMSDLSHRDQYLLGQCYHNKQDYGKAIKVFLNLPSNEASNLIVFSYFKLHDMDGLFTYLNKLFDTFHINMLLPDQPLLLLAIKYDADIKDIKYLLEHGAHPWITGKYHDSALSQAIYNRDDGMIHLFLTYMGYPIVYEWYITENLVLKKNENIQYYLYKIFFEKKMELLEKYGQAFYNDCYDNIDNPDNLDDISDKFCTFLQNNKDFINEKLGTYGIQIVNK